MFLFFVAVVSSGLLLLYGTRGNSLHGYWKNVHVFSAGTFAVLAALHWILHGYWFKALFKKQ